MAELDCKPLPFVLKGRVAELKKKIDKHAKYGDRDADFHRTLLKAMNMKRLSRSDFDTLDLLLEAYSI